MIESGFLLVGFGIVAVAAVDKFCEEHGFVRVGSTLKMVVPLAGMLAAVYFLGHNPILAWLK